MNIKNTFLISIAVLPVFCNAGTWSYGLVNITESFASKIYVRWTGPSTQECGDNDVAFDADSLGSEEALKRGFAIALAAAAAQKPIRFWLDGCLGSLQKATVVQFCAKADCAY